jgi:hypothetical protein
MKTIKINPIEIELEIIAEISEKQAQIIEGGGSCFRTSCHGTGLGDSSWCTKAD